MGHGTWASTHISGAQCAPQGLNSLLYKNKLNFLFFVIKVSVVTQPCRYQGAHALSPCRRAGRQQTLWGAGSDTPLQGLTASLHPAHSSAPTAAHTRFRSRVCKEGKPAPEQAGVVSDTAIGSRALPAPPAGTESQALCPALPLHPCKQHSTRNSMTRSCPGVGRREDGKWLGQDWSQTTLLPELNTPILASMRPNKAARDMDLFKPSAHFI